MKAPSASGTRVVAGALHRVQRGRGKGFSAELPPEPPHRPARVAVTLALAHAIQRAIDKGEIRDQADAARRLGVTRARMTQILDLTLLAPDVQARILSLEAVNLAEPIGERALRRIAYALAWAEQRQLVDRYLVASPEHRLALPDRRRHLRLQVDRLRGG